MDENYWQPRCGSDYAKSYHAQEVWFLDYLARLNQQRRGHQIRLLDFGCGFGRIARKVCTLDYIDYYGYDFSPAMVEELKNAPPEAIATDFDRRVRVAGSLQEAFGKETLFDLILTISVMIHNPANRARATMVSMLDYLTPGSGRLVFIENPYTAISSVENFQNSGCWCHAFPRYIDGKADMEILDRFADRHAIYLVTPHETPRVSRYLYRETPNAEAVPLDYAGILARGLDRAVVNAETLTAELFAFDRRIHDLTEEAQEKAEAGSSLASTQGHHEAVQREFRQALQYKAEAESRLFSLCGQYEVVQNELGLARLDITRLEGEVAVARSETAAARARFADRQKLLEDLGLGLTAARKMAWRAPAEQHASHAQAAAPDNVLWNDRRDVQYANHLPEMQQVLHIFHQEWIGIRAAVGSLGGQKLAIAADRALSNEDILQIYKAIADKMFLRIVFHGMSENAIKLISLLHRRGLNDRLYLVMHGSPEQWVFTKERDMALAAIELLRAGFVKKLHVMKRGFYFPADGLFRPILFNMAPKLAEIFPVEGVNALQLSGVAFSAGWSNWRKNVHTNLMGAALSEKISAVWHHAGDVRLPEPLHAKLVHKSFATREDTFYLMALASLSLNVSITDCHPMVNIESQALGRPCLRSNLHLDALEDHPYVDLTMVTDASSVIGITQAIDRILAIPEDERREMTLNYQEQSDRVSRTRYREFLEI